MSGVFGGGGGGLVSGGPTGLWARAQIPLQASSVGAWTAISLNTFTGQGWISAGGVLTLPAGFNYSFFANTEYSVGGVGYMGIGIGSTAPPATYLGLNQCPSASAVNQLKLDSFAAGTYIFVANSSSAVNFGPISALPAPRCYVYVSQLNL